MRAEDDDEETGKYKAVSYTHLNFYGSTYIRTLVDTDYVKTEPYAIDSFTVSIQGDLLKENRDFCVKVTPNSDYRNPVDVILEDKYTYTKLDTVYQVFYYKINRPKVESGRNVYGCYLEFDLDNPCLLYTSRCV